MTSYQEIAKAMQDAVALREQNKTLPYLEKDLLTTIIMQNAAIIRLLEQLNGRV